MKNKTKKNFIIVILILLGLLTSWYIYLALTPPNPTSGGIYDPQTNKFYLPD
jgi:hypothetical protein